MKTSFTSLLLLGLAVLSSAQPGPCQLNFWKTGSTGHIYYDGTNDVAPFTGWDTLDPNEPGAQQYTFSSLNGVVAIYCDTCILTIYSTDSFGGLSETYSYMETPNQIPFPFCAKSFVLDCDNEPETPEEEEEEEEEEEQELGQQPE